MDARNAPNVAETAAPRAFVAPRRNSDRLPSPTLGHQRRAVLRGTALVMLGSLATLLGGFAAPPAKTAPPPTDAKPADATTPPPTDAKPADAASAGLGTVFAVLETSKGDIVLELDGDRAPISVENFLTYIDDDHYDGTIFHRVIDSFMIQGGGFNEKLESKSTRPPIRNEWTNGLRNDRGTIAMARLPQPDSATAQFFINVRDNPALNGNVERGVTGYAVFGKVVAGMDVVDAIRAVPTHAQGMHPHVPKEAIVIRSAKRLEKDDAEKRIQAAGEGEADSESEGGKPAPEKPAGGDGAGGAENKPSPR